MLAGFALLIILMMKLWPDIPASRLLHRALVEAPLRRLAAMERRHLIYAAVLLGMTFASAELIMLLGSADVVMLMAWDVSLYVDALIATWTLAGIARTKAAWRMILPMRKPRPRARRRRRVEIGKPANDSEDDGGDWAYAA